MNPTLYYWIHVWSQLRWYVKILLILILLRIGNSFYRMFMESKDAKKKRKNRENSDSTAYSDKVVQFKRQWKEIDTVLSQSEKNVTESFTDTIASPPTVRTTGLAMMTHVWNRAFEGIYYLHRVFKQFMCAFLADFVAPKIYRCTKLI